MNFRAIQVVCMAVSRLMDEMQWAEYTTQKLHTPVINVQKDCDDLDMLMDMMGTLTRMLDTRIHYVTSEGKVIKEWIETILMIGQRYRRELELLEALEKRVNLSDEGSSTAPPVTGT
jgi:hypothetical protein